jgi:hypothetical protein
MLSKDDILKSDDLAKETVPVPEWGGEVIVKTLTGTERDYFESSVYHDGVRDFDNIRAKLCVMSMVDEAGKTLFTVYDIERLGAKSGKALDRVFAVAKRLSGIGKQEIEALKKNLKTTQ